MSRKPITRAIDVSPYDPSKAVYLTTDEYNLIKAALRYQAEYCPVSIIRYQTKLLLDRLTEQCETSPL